MTVAITNVYGVSRVEGIVPLDSVLVFAIVRNHVRRQIVESDGVGPCAACNRSSEREEITEGAEAVDLKILDAESIRDSELAGREPGYADVADRVRSLDILRNVVGTEIQCVGCCVWRSRREARNSRIPVKAGKTLAENGIRCRFAVDKPRRHIESLGEEAV